MVVVQAAKIIVRVALGGSFVKITVPFNINCYHTTLETKETRLNTQSL